MRITTGLVSTLALLLAWPTLADNNPAATIRSPDISKHVRYLASDALEGRGTGTQGERKAGAYLAKEFAKYGLKPGGAEGSFYQSFQVAGRARLKGTTTLKIEGGATNTWYRELKLGTDFNPFGFSGSLTKDGLELVFAGYGITDKARGYDDYAGLDVKGKAVLILRHEPRERELGGRFSRHSQFVVKARNAKAHGAAAVLVVTDPLNHPNDDRLMPFYGGQSAGVFAAHVRRSLIVKLFELLGKDLVAIQKGIDKNLKPSSFAIGKLDVRAEIDRDAVTARNVIARLEGSDPKLKHEIVVIGAHYDHLGKGNHGGSLQRGSQGVIHNGADDNASGTAGILELAQAFAMDPPKRTLVFIGFSGEERGLLGSRHFVRNPTIDLKKVAAMINLDMIGRLRDDMLSVGGVDTAPGFRKMVGKALKASGLKGNLTGSGFGPSDHASFYRAKMPVLFFFTGLHKDYHRPSDVAKLLNNEGAAKVARVAYACIRQIAEANAKPKYVAVRPQRRRGMRNMRNRARLGVIPSREQAEGGAKIRFVQKGGPAAEAGMKAGDVIFKLGEHPVKNLREMITAIGKYKPGDQVLVRVKRAGKTVKLKVKLGRYGQ